MPNSSQFPSARLRLRLAADGPLLAWTHWSANETEICTRIFATPDDTESDPAAGLLISYLDTGHTRKFIVAMRSNHPDDHEARATFFVGDAAIPLADFGTRGAVAIEVFTLHVIAEQGQVFVPPDLAVLTAIVNKGFDFDVKRLELESRLQENLAMLIDPKPSSHSFESRSNRTLNEAVVTVRLPPKKEDAKDFKFIATTCRYPGFAFESQRVDAASFDIIAKDPANASGMLMLGDQIYADATASLFDNLTSIEKFQERYHKMFRSPGFAKAVRSIPCYMTGDDHEFSDSWSIPDNSLRSKLYAAAQQSYGVYQVSHSPFAGALNTPPYDYSFTCGPVAVYVMDTISKRDTKTPGAEVIVSPEQLLKFKTWLAGLAAHFKYVILATGGVVAPGFKIALDAAGETDVSRAQGWENWQAFNDQRIKLFKILEASDRKILLVSGDYHCAAKASITKGGNHIAEAVVAPPAYAPMRYVSKTTAMLAEVETTQGYEIRMREPTEGSGFAVIKIQNGEWAVEFKTVEVADT